MVKKTFSLRFIMMWMWMGVSFQFSYAQTGGWNVTRFTKDNTTSSTILEVVDNPIKEIGTNESEKVLRLTDIDRRGCICLNLTRYIGDAKERIDIGKYDRLRFKYYIVNPPYSDYKVRVRMADGTGDVVDAEWTDTDKNWKTATFQFSKDSEATWIQLQTYYTSVGEWNDLFPGMTIYLDDVELLDSDYSVASLSESYEKEKISFCQKGRNLKISNLHAGEFVAAYDMLGKLLFTKNGKRNEVTFDFPEKGLYVVTICSNNKVCSRKIIIGD